MAVPNVMTCAAGVSRLSRCVSFSHVRGRRYVDASDLQLFKDKIEKEDQPSDVGAWEPMMDKDFGDFTYTAWRRKLPVSTLGHFMACAHTRTVYFCRPRRNDAEIRTEKVTVLKLLKQAISILQCIALVKGQSWGDKRILQHSQGPLKQRRCGVFRGRFACWVIPRGVGCPCQLPIANEPFYLGPVCLKLT